MQTPHAESHSALDRPTLVLNRSWVPVHVTAVRRAICMVCSGVAQIVDPGPLTLHDLATWIRMVPDDDAPGIRSAARRIRVPEIVQLHRYDRVPSIEAPFTRQNLFRRDDHRCQYCAAKPPHSQLTIDHVIPRARGGRTTWENCVVACVRCNARKGDRALPVHGMRLLRVPRAPRWSPCLNIRRDDWPGSWGQFLSDRTSATGS